MRESTFTLVYWGFIPSFPTKSQLVLACFSNVCSLSLILSSSTLSTSTHKYQLSSPPQSHCHHFQLCTSKQIIPVKFIIFQRDGGEKSKKTNFSKTPITGFTLKITKDDSATQKQALGHRHGLNTETWPKRSVKQTSVSR